MNGRYPIVAEQTNTINAIKAPVILDSANARWQAVQPAGQLSDIHWLQARTRSSWSAGNAEASGWRRFGGAFGPDPLDERYDGIGALAPVDRPDCDFSRCRVLGRERLFDPATLLEALN